MEKLKTLIREYYNSKLIKYSLDELTEIRNNIINIDDAVDKLRDSDEIDDEINEYFFNEEVNKIKKLESEMDEQEIFNNDVAILNEMGLALDSFFFTIEEIDDEIMRRFEV